ncbi:MAG: LamG-like jellyroll fold domain-containing protein [Promethearchaeota archaeon]|jgi:hypothetical protein
MQEHLIGYLKFDEIIGKNSIFDHASNNEYKIKGFFDLPKGVKGNALRFDGYSTHVIIPQSKLTNFSNHFTIMTWIAVGTYPWNDAPIIENYNEDMGFFLGITDEGRIQFKVAIDDKWYSTQTKTACLLYEWIFITAIYNYEDGISLYVNGDQVESIEFEKGGDSIMLPREITYIGRAAKAVKPAQYYLPDSSLETNFYLDCIIDEFKLFNHSFTADQVNNEFNSITNVGVPPLEKRGLPKIPRNDDKFGSYYTRLKYTKEWDRLWRIREHADVVVNFDDAPYSFVFWHGANYIPHWVTGNGIWYTNEFNEAWAPNVSGSAEPMSDKQCKYTHVRIIESNDARVIVHWRYALIDTRGVQANIDWFTGWGDWSDEYYIIYPDGIGIRDITLHSTRPMAPHEFQESIILISEGQRPEDVLENDSVTFLNMEGESHTYSWETGRPDYFIKPRNKNIEVINIKSNTVPFFIVPDGPCVVAGFLFNGRHRRNPFFFPYYYSTRLEYSKWPWHRAWPITTIPCDGAGTHYSDRPSHTNVSSMAEWEDYEVGPEFRRRIMMHGLWDKNEYPLVELVDLAKSWLKAPEIELKSNNYISEGYFQHERAYYFSCSDSKAKIILEFTINATITNPIVNPAFVIRNLNTELELELDGKKIPRGKKFRYGKNYGIESNKLVIWIRHQASKPIKIKIIPKEADNK